MISIEGLTKYYGGGEARARVLADVSLTIEDGEFVSIIGTSGSGKTTLLNVIGGLDQSFEGSVKVDDRELRGLAERELAELRNARFGFVFQQFNLIDHLTSLENVVLPGFFSKNSDGSAAAARGRELLERLAIGDKLEEQPTRLSGGQKQRVAIARALFGSPSIVLCDEPTGSLDRKTGVSILRLFQRLNQEDGITVIMVTHEEHVARMSRRIIRLEDGEVISDQVNDPVDPDDDIVGGEAA